MSGNTMSGNSMSSHGMPGNGMSGNTEDLAQSVRSGIKAIWWLYLIRGIVTVIFGIIALSSPAVVASVLAFIIGIYLVIDGIFLLIGAASQAKNTPGRGWNTARGIMTTVAGIYIMILPTWAATFVGLFIVWTMIVWSFLVGMYGIIAALKSRGYNSSWGWGLVSSAFTVILSVGFAVLVITDPAFAIKALVWVAGFWALIVGLGLVFIAFRVRRGVNLLGDEMADAIRHSAS